MESIYHWITNFFCYSFNILAHRGSIPMNTQGDRSNIFCACLPCLRINRKGSIPYSNHKNYLMMGWDFKRDFFSKSSLLTTFILSHLLLIKKVCNKFVTCYMKMRGVVLLHTFQSSYIKITIL